MTQALLLGAGRGSRLDAERGAGPKWALEIAGQSLAQHLINVLHAHDITDITLVRGPLGGMANTPSVAYRDVTSRNMLDTLSQVRDVVNDDVLVLYCDLILEPRVVGKLLRASDEACIAIDDNWRELFALRADDAESIAESCVLLGDRLVEIGQPLSGKSPEHQYIGAMRFSMSSFDKAMNIYDELATVFANRPWRNANAFESAYMTDFLQELIDRGVALTPVRVRGGWLEFDTPRDLSIARGLFAAPRPEIFDFSSLPTLPYVVSAGGVAIRTTDDKSEVLLVGSGLDGEWRIPKGMLEPREPKSVAAAREVREEAGVGVEVGALVSTEEWTYRYDNRDWRERCYFFRLAPVEDVAPTPDQEHAVAAWVPVSRAVNAMQYPEELRALMRALAPIDAHGGGAT